MYVTSKSVAQFLGAYGQLQVFQRLSTVCNFPTDAILVQAI
jgi:hypothetical protein